MKQLVLVSIGVLFVTTMTLLDGCSKSPEQEVSKTVNSWLECQKRGEDGREYWTVTPKNLFAVTSWKIVKVDFPHGTAEANVRIDSSTKGGIPIRKMWKITLYHWPDGWVIRRIEEK